MKRVTNFLHLLLGLALLATGAYFFRGLAHEGKLRWQQTFVSSESTAPAKAPTVSEDPILGAASVNTYGVLAQSGKAAVEDQTAPTPSSASPSALDHVSAVDAGAPNHFLHKRLAVKTYKAFAFEVAAHAINPQVEGIFHSVATQQNPAAGPSLEILLMSDTEFASFVASHDPASAEFSAEPSHGGSIHWNLNATFAKPQKYYLVLRNSAPEQGPSTVDADFTARFN